jgi:hypothetical protein
VDAFAKTWGAFPDCATMPLMLGAPLFYWFSCIAVSRRSMATWRMLQSCDFKESVLPEILENPFSVARASITPDTKLEAEFHGQG